MRIESITTLIADVHTLAGVEEWLKELDRFGISRDTGLFDGAQLHPEGSPSLDAYVGYPKLAGQITLRDLAEWVSHLYANGATPETELLETGDLAVDLPVADIFPVSCGSCVDPNVLDVLVSAHKHED